MTTPQPAWTARTGTEPAADLVTYGECTGTDEALLELDLAGSIAHVAGLHGADLLTREEATELVEGLQSLAADADEIELDPQLEDVHMNVEHLLGERLGPVAAKLHTARSRNDQVALDVMLAARLGLASLAEATHALAEALAETAAQHLATPWPLHTHGIPAQPATLGYLLHAHAARFAGALEDQLALLEGWTESPLGAAAGAGTTLPIDPGVAADLLGLDPTSNGLLATGARDGSIAATQAAAQVGRLSRDLAADLLALADEALVELPEAYTTGSSIMPHKRNPDALELVRADGTKLAHLSHRIEELATGLGLGYDRDLQRTKPPLLEALDTAPPMVAILAAIVDELTVDGDQAHQLQAEHSPAIATTGAVEALVDHGVPFREAHQAVSEACQAAEQGTPLPAALQDAELPEDALAAALDALEPDPARRATPGGPAPEHLQPALASLGDELDALAARLAEARATAEQPQALLDTPPDQLLADPAKVVP